MEWWRAEWAVAPLQKVLAAGRGATVFATPHHNPGCIHLRQPFNNRLKVQKRMVGGGGGGAE